MTPRMTKLEAKFRQADIQAKLLEIEDRARDGAADQYANRDRLHHELITMLAPEFLDGGDGYAFVGGSNAYLIETDPANPEGPSLGSCDYEFDALKGIITLNCHDDGGNNVETYSFHLPR